MQVKNSINQAVCRRHFSVWWVAGMEGIVTQALGAALACALVRYRKGLVCGASALWQLH